jgi:transposase
MNKKQLDVSLKNHVINLHKRKYKICDIAEIYQVTNKTIYNIINKYNCTQTVRRKKGSGRKMDEHILNTIKNIVYNDHNLSLSDISSILLNKHNIKCSKSTIHLYLTKNNFVNRAPIIKPLLTQEHLNQRQNWAIFYQNYCWNNVIWSDETTINIQSNKLSKIWIYKDDIKINRIVKYPIKIHIWGCILKNYKLIVCIYDKTMNSDKYIEVLNEKLLSLIDLVKKKKNNRLIFQQDNAPCHTSLKMCEYFSNNNIEVMYWPANSPDLNPIENVWNLLKRNIGKIYVKNKQELIEVILDQVKKIKIKNINNIIDSMDNRINDLFNNSFDSIDY